ncbi:MAG: hypothetical protein K1X44_02640 [Alphaproteobacteria bacterium]|nr:hypothetical protein [Alphaproteobacteria bacterium]
MNNADLRLILSLALAGTLGGILSGIQSKRGFVLPSITLVNQKRSYHLGFIGDALSGLVGTLAIFLLMPVNPTPEGVINFIRFIALSLLSGYCFNALVEWVFVRTTKGIEERAKTIEERIRFQIEQSKRDGEILILINELLRGIDGPDMSQDDFNKIVTSASSKTRAQIYIQANDHRILHTPKRPEVMERVLPIFTALAVVEPMESAHRCYAQLGMVLKDKSDPDFLAAREAFDFAISLRNQSGHQGAPYYEYQRAVCNIVLDSENEDTDKDRINNIILTDLRFATRYPRTAQAISQDEIVNDWLYKNGYSSTILEQE